MKRVSKEQCINSLQRANVYFGRTFSKKEYDNWCDSNPNTIKSFTIISKFDSWNEAKVSSGLMTIPLGQPKKPLEKRIEKVIPFIQKTAEKYGNNFSYNDYKEFSKKNKGFPSIFTIRELGGGLTKLKELAGVPKIKPVKEKRRKISKDDCLEALRKCYEENGYINHTIYRKWYKNNKKYPSLFPIKDLFGNFTTAVNALKIPNINRISPKKIFSRNECLIAISVFYKEMKSLRSEDYIEWQKKNKSYPSILFIRRVFPDWKSAVREFKHQRKVAQ